MTNLNPLSTTRVTYYHITQDRWRFHSRVSKLRQGANEFPDLNLRNIALQYLDGVDPSATLVAGDTAWLTLLEESSDFRTNIGFTNSSGASTRVRVALFDGSGAMLAVFERIRRAAESKA